MHAAIGPIPFSLIQLKSIRSRSQHQIQPQPDPIQCKPIYTIRLRWKSLVKKRPEKSKVNSKCPGPRPPSRFFDPSHTASRKKKKDKTKKILEERKKISATPETPSKISPHPPGSCLLAREHQPPYGASKPTIITPKETRHARKGQNTAIRAPFDALAGTPLFPSPE